MRYAQLGRSGLIVSRVTLGCLTFGGQADSALYKVDAGEAARIVARARDAGINLFDTADLYAGGLSEEFLGRAIEGTRHEILISSKGGFRTGPGIGDAGLSRAHLMAAVEASLRRLKTDYLDIYYAHKTDPLTPLDETLRALDDIVRSGKARYVGFSNWPAWQAAIAIERQRQQGYAPFVTGQIAYSLVMRDAEYELLPFMENEGVGATAWSPLAGGFLTGKYDRAALADPKSRVAISTLPYDREAGLAIVDVLRSIAAARSCTIAQVAIAWVLRRPAVASALVGVSRLDQLGELAAAADIMLSDDEIASLGAAASMRPLYPHWHIAASQDRVAFDAIGREPPVGAGASGAADIAATAKK